MGAFLTFQIQLLEDGLKHDGGDLRGDGGLAVPHGYLRVRALPPLWCSGLRQGRASGTNDLDGFVAFHAEEIGHRCPIYKRKIGHLCPNTKRR